MDRRRPPRPKSLALSQPSHHFQPHMSSTATTPTSILKRPLGGGGSFEHDGPSAHSRLDEETAAYKRRLESYRQAQSQQALLVARLQSKLLQYKQRCSSLESKLGQNPPGQDLVFGSGGRGGGDFLTPRSQGGPPTDFDDALWRLEQEKVRNESLMHLNRDLRGELEETRKINETLSGDLQRLSDDWDNLTEKMAEREKVWREEEAAYSDYYAFEHTKLLELWKEVSGAKREFTELRSSTGRELAQLKNALLRTSNLISSTVISTAVSTPSPQQEAQQTSFIKQLSAEIETSQKAQDKLRKQLKERDEKILAVEKNMSELEEQLSTADKELKKITSQDMLLLSNSLKEIGKLLISDFDSHGLEEPHDVHLTSTPSIFVNNDENSSGNNPAVFAESIVSAVQAALNKRHLQIHQLQVSLASSKEQNAVARGHVDSLETDLSKNEEKLKGLGEMNEKLKDELESVKIEREKALRGLESLKNEKNILEGQRKGLATELEAALKIKASLSTNLAKLEKSMEGNRDEVVTLKEELEKVKDELSNVLTKLKLETELGLKIKEQLSSASEDKEKNSTENKTLKNQLNEIRSEESLAKWKMDAEILADKLRSATERADSNEKEKKKWHERVKSLEEVKKQLESDLTDARNDLASLRRETLESERVRTELESRVERLITVSDGAENRKNVLENQIESQREEYLREMGLMSERIDMLTEELTAARRDYDDALQILDRSKADLSNQEKLHMEAVHVIEKRDALIKKISAELDKIRHEKNSLEELEQTLKTSLIEKDRKIDGAERAISDIKQKLNAELSSLKERLKGAEAENKRIREKSEEEKSGLEAKFNKEIESARVGLSAAEERLRAEYEEKATCLKKNLEGEKKSEGTKLSNEINSLRQQMESLRVQYDESLLRAENDKQQGLLLAQQDQQGLSDKIRLIERELDETRTEKDRLKREYELKASHEKSSAASLRSEIIRLKNEVETTRQDSFESVKNIEIRLAEIEKEREGALLLVEELRNKVKSMEERESEIKGELYENMRKLREAEAVGEGTRRELVEARQTLAELTNEKEKNNSVMEQLRDELDRREQEMNLQKKDLSKVQASLKGLERLKGELEAEVSNLVLKLESFSREKSEAGKQVEELSENLSNSKSYAEKLEGELAEVRVRLETETEKRDDAEALLRNSKKMLEDAENQLVATKQEEERLGAKLGEMEERYAARENQMHGLNEEYKQREKKLLDEKHNLNVSLMTLQQQMEQQTAKVQMAENRLKGLNEEKSELERLKKESEGKLAQIQSGFKRLGISASSLDNPDAARRLMSTLQAQMASLQQDRDLLATQLSQCRENLAVLETTKAGLEEQASSLHHSLSSLRTESKGKDSIIAKLEKECSLKLSEVGRLAERVRESEEERGRKEEEVRRSKGEREGLKEELERYRAKLDESRAYSDSKLAKAEVQLRALEGDLNRTTLVLTQKEAHIQALEEKCSVMHRNVGELEERTASLTMTVESLNISLEKAGQGEEEWRERYNSVSRLSSENSATLASTNEKMRNLLREKAALEQERNSLSEKWEASSAALSDFKRQVQTLAEKNAKLRAQSEDMTRMAIEKQIKSTLGESGKEELRGIVSEKIELQRKNDALADRLKELERENRELERIKESMLNKGVARSPIVRDNAMTVLEEENSELRRRIGKLEAEIRELERRHVKHIAEVTSQVKQERDFELERARGAKLQAERLLEAREGNYRQQISRLESQVSNLKEQLGEEMRRRQSFLSRSFRSGQEVKSLRQALGDSLRNVSMDPNTLENETRRLDSTLDMHKSGSQASLLSPNVGGGYKSATPTPK